MLKKNGARVVAVLEPKLDVVTQILFHLLRGNVRMACKHGRVELTVFGIEAKFERSLAKPWIHNLPPVSVFV